jgi:DNA polymerase-3 subunit delta'
MAATWAGEFVKPCSSFAAFIGNPRVVDIILRAVDQGRLPHAMIFAGPAGVGKRTLALLLSRLLNCLSPRDNQACGVCGSCRKIEAASHPDVREIQPEGNFIKIETVRELIAEIAYQPFEGRFRVVIFDGADQMKKETHNSLLKTLEEPPSRTILILVTTKPYLLLDTIRSRARILQFGSIPHAQIESHLIKAAIRQPEEARLAALFSNGSLAAALEFDPTRYQASRARALRFVTLILQRGGFAEASPLAAEVAKDKELFPIWIESVLSLLQDIYFAGVAPERIVQRDIRGEIDKLAHVAPHSAVVSAIDALRGLRSGTRNNENRQIAVEALFIRSRTGNTPFI